MFIKTATPWVVIDAAYYGSLQSDLQIFIASEVLARLNAAVALAERSTQPEALTSWWPLLLSLLGIVLALFSWLRSGARKSIRHHSKVD
eukprot:s2527_g6.t1